MAKKYLILTKCIDCKKERLANKWSYGQRCKSCSNSFNKKGKTGRRINLVGQIFGRLEVISFEKIHNNRQCLWRCKCECGNEIILLGSTLKNGITKSCGCLVRSQKGLSNTTTYNVWSTMIARCYNPKNSSFKNYGARGITVCDRWKSSILNFIEDMGMHKKGTSIDRINNNGNYCKENCKWATCKEQARNTRSNHIIEGFGKKLSLAEWAERLNISQSTIRKRLKKYTNVEDILFKGKLSKFGKDAVFSAFGFSMSLGEFSKLKGIKYSTVRSRLINGFSIEEALNPCIRPGKKIKAFGEYLKSSEWSIKTGINKSTIECRIMRGWSAEKALTVKVDTRFISRSKNK